MGSCALFQVSQCLLSANTSRRGPFDFVPDQENWSNSQFVIDIAVERLKRLDLNFVSFCEIDVCCTELASAIFCDG